MSEDGTIAEDIGGGISRVATTPFSAALFARLEFRDYPSHLIDVARSPTPGIPADVEGLTRP